MKFTEYAKNGHIYQHRINGQIVSKWKYLEELKRRKRYKSTYGLTTKDFMKNGGIRTNHYFPVS